MLPQSLFFNKVASLRPVILLEKLLWGYIYWRSLQWKTSFLWSDLETYVEMTLKNV